MIKLGTVHVEHGEKKNGWLQVEKSELKLPFTAICGRADGPAVLVSAGVHGAEYVGIQTVLELSRELEAEDIRGSLVFLLLANPTASRNYTRFVVPEDGKNLNRVFPGKADGTLSERIAYTIVHELQSQADYYIDVHAGDTSEAVMPFVYFTQVAREEVCQVSEEMAKAADTAIRASSTATTGAYSCACIHGIPSILMERGGRGVYTREEVELYKQDIRNVLIRLKVLSGEEKHTVEQKRVDQAVYVEAEQDGFWYPRLQAGDTFLEGALLGELKDVWGNLLFSCHTQYNGIVLYQTVALGVKAGDPLIAYGML